MSKFWFFIASLVFALPIRAAEIPTVDWYVQTVVSDNVPNRRNVVKRAVLSYRESAPHLQVEVIDWSSGMGGQILLLSKGVDIEGGRKICPDPAESWCGNMESVFWKGQKLVHSFAAMGATYTCSTTIADDLSVTTKCAGNKP